MSKAIAGAAILAGDVLAVAAAVEFDPALLSNPYFQKAIEATALMGVGMLAGAAADALTSNRGMNITTRQPAANRQIIYGSQRVGGVEIYSSTTGSHHDQYNFCIVIADHECWGIDALYLDGRKVWFDEASSGHSVRNGNSFGGSANHGTYTGPDGQQYNFGGKVYCEARYGDQGAGDVIGGFTANDPAWAASAAGSPYLGGCTYVYLKVEYDTALFPGKPEVRFTVFGKPVLDPRTGIRAWSANAALVAADWAMDRVSGLGLTLNAAALIAAANVCDEQVALANGGLEHRYECHYHFDTGTAPSDAYATMLKAMGGRRTNAGGEEIIVPAYWQGPSASFDEGSLTAAMQWDPYLSFKDLCNRVTGTFTCPNYPYNVAGNAYDTNGFDNSGNAQNNFQFGYQPTNFPQYAADPLHGFPADEYLNQDSGVSAAYNPANDYAAGTLVSYSTTIAGRTFASVWRALQNVDPGTVPGHAPLYWENAAVALNREVSYQMVLSIGQAQRLAKIELMRSRFMGGGTFEMGLAALTMQDFDVMNFTFPLHGWTDKQLEVTDVTFKTITRDVEPGELPAAPECRLTLAVHETSETIYEWAPGEELNIYDLPGVMQGTPRTPAAPTSMTLISGASTAITAPDGTITPRIEVTWATPLDGFASAIQVRYRPTGTSVWLTGPLVDIALNAGYISPIVAGQQYDVQIRSVRPSGAASVWVEIDGFTADLVLAIGTQQGLGAGSLIGEAFSNGTAAIICNPFSATIGSITRSITPNPSVDTGLLQGRTYYVYWIDPTFAGGSVTAIATLNTSDYLGKPGYYLIGSITTPIYTGGSGGGSGTSRYPPSYSQDIGDRTTASPDAAYDGDVTTYASVTGSSTPALPGTGSFPDIAIGNCIYSGFAPVGSGSGATLTVIAQTFGAVNQASIDVTIGGTTYNVMSVSSFTPQTTYTYAIPASTALNTISVSCVAVATPATGSVARVATMQVSEIYIDV